MLFLTLKKLYLNACNIYHSRLLLASPNLFSVKQELPAYIPIVDDSPEMIVESQPRDSALARACMRHILMNKERGRRARNIAPVATQGQAARVNGG